jgi:hypothetical protein
VPFVPEPLAPVRHLQPGRIDHHRVPLAPVQAGRAETLMNSPPDCTG